MSLNFEDPANFGNSDYVRAIPNEELDVTVVDATEASLWQTRPVCFKTCGEPD